MKFRIRKHRGDWLLEEQVSENFWVELSTVGSHEGACREMDHEVWLLNRDRYAGKTFSVARKVYRRQRATARERGRLGSHVGTDRMHAGGAPAAMGAAPALVAGALLHQMPPDGGAVAQ